jgi:hypothetical protein
MIKRLLLSLAVLAGLVALADRGAAYVAGNATAHEIRVHEGLREDPDVTFRGFPFVTQAVRGEFRRVDVTLHDLERGGLTMARIDAQLDGVRVDLSKALKGRVAAVPVDHGSATVRVTYGDLNGFLATKPGNVHVVVHDGRAFVRASFGVAGAGQTEVEGTPRVSVTRTSVRVTTTNVHPVAGGSPLSAALAAAAATRASFTVPLEEMPFGIEVGSAELTPTGLVVRATASGFVVDVRDNVG